MTAYAIPVWEVPSVPVEGEAKRFPVRRIYCVGRNYAAHAREMGFDPDREPPFFFCKPADAIVQNGGVVPYPPQTKNLHYEFELVVAIGKQGANIPEAKALEHAWGYGCGLDMTRRDVQIAARDKGRPWDMGKGFDHSAPCTALVPASKIGHIAAGKIELKVNGQVKQSSDLKMMIWNIPETISYLSGLVELFPGDLIYTGTPEGVGPVVKGDKLEGTIDKVGKLGVTIG
ncbi:MAG: fumarylacetoacetate hydrolase family protein [Alphaproteobacteria bacterium]|nr:fumarylacetoacetate hydrolase family protein [Alphaproteobacteria bacterium]